MINQLIPIAVENIDAGVVVPSELFHIELLFYKYGGGDQAHIIFSILDNVIDQLLSEFFIFVDFERIAIEVAKELFKLVKVHHVAVRVVHLIEELEKLMQLFIAQAL